MGASGLGLCACWWLLVFMTQFMPSDKGAHRCHMLFMRVQLYLEVIAYQTAHAAYFLLRQIVVSVE